MIKYITDFLTVGQDDNTYVDSKKTYFSPWWKFWNRKVQSETSKNGYWIREYDRAGKIIKIHHQIGRLSSSKSGKSIRWGTLDTETSTITFYPTENTEVHIFPTGKYDRTRFLPNGCKQVVYGYLTKSGTMVNRALCTYEQGHLRHYTRLHRREEEDIFRRVLRKHPISLEEKAKLLDKASTLTLEKNAATDQAASHSFHCEQDKMRFIKYHCYVHPLLEQIRFERKQRDILSFVKTRV